MARRRPLLARRPAPVPPQQRVAGSRVLTASASEIKIADRSEAKRLKRVRQAWQEEAWAYRRSLGEIRYAVAYLGNSAMRMRLFPGAYIPGDQVPVNVLENPDIPPDLAAAAQDVLDRLATGGPNAASQLMKRMTENFEVAGEGYLIGRTDPLTQTETWSFHSISELQISDNGQYLLCEMPTIGGSASREDSIELDDLNDFVIRMWWPDPQFGQMADSPVRAILDLCEELLLLGRDVRATARSRLANNGILFLPDTLSVTRPGGAGNEDEISEDPFFSEMIESATAAISDESSASAVVPIVARGPVDAIAAVKHLTIERKEHGNNGNVRMELIGRMATGLDLPSEVLTGKVDLNHWTAWQVDDDAFRHHIEPIVIVQVDALTAGFMWPMLEAYNLWSTDLIRKVLVWYDPTELLTHPDRSADAFQAWDRMAISDAALRRYLGFPDTDAPSNEELLFRLATHLKTLDPALQQQILHNLDSSVVPPYVTPTDAAPIPAPTDPALPPGGAATPAPPALPAGPATTPHGPPPAPDPAVPAQASAEAAFIAQALKQLLAAQPVVIDGIVASSSSNGHRKASAAERRASKKLASIDRDLRNRLQTAANASIKRALEKAGARVLNKARGVQHAAIRAAVVDTPPALIPGKVGPAIVASLGLHERGLLDNAFDELHHQWDRWVSDAQREAIRIAATITGADAGTVEARRAVNLHAAREAGWRRMQASVDLRATEALQSTESIPPDELDTYDFAKSSDIRAAVAVAGGYLMRPGSSGINDAGFAVDSSDPLTGIGNGYLVEGTLTSEGASVQNYEWLHGPSMRPFEPHFELDGQEFENFDSEVLANGGDFPDSPFYSPGDHDGCSCDFQPIWVAAAPDSTDN